MQWDSGRNLGFSEGLPMDLYLPVDAAEDAPTVEAQEKDPESLLNFVRSVTALRAQEEDLQADAPFEVLEEKWKDLQTRREAIDEGYKHLRSKRYKGTLRDLSRYEKLAGKSKADLSPDEEKELSVLLERISQNGGLENKITRCRAHITEGDGFAEALQKEHFFNNLYSRMIAIGVKTGNLDSILNKIARIYEEETDKKIRNFISVLEPTLVISLSLVVGLILLSVILPLLSIMTSIG